jgi:preprotein translocase subunit SecA
VESQNFEIRKHLLKYDDVMNQQREIIYSRRRRILEGLDLKEEFFECLSVGIEAFLIGWDENPEPETFAKNILYRYAINLKPENVTRMRASEVLEHVIEASRKGYTAREEFLGAERMRELEKMVMLSVIDSNWKEYLRDIDDLREGISWRAYAQKDPLVEFQHEAFKLFSDLMTKIDDETAEKIMKLSAMEEHYRKNVFQPAKTKLEHPRYSAIGASSAGQDEVYDKNVKPVQPSGEVFREATHKKDTSYKREDPKVGRNDPCPCGSGKKYKKCCGQ